MAPPFFFASCPFISMSETTQGVRVQSGSRALRAGVELLSSMRFAISLLTVICIASVIGTVLKQHEPAVNYVNQFGPFWAELFGALQLNAVYSAWWFLLILAFLVVSTSLCIARNTPKFLSDIKSYKENVREQSLRAFHHKAEAALAEGTEAEARRIGGMLASGGWKVRLQQRDTAAGPGTGWMVAAKAGAANKIGYIAAHSALELHALLHHRLRGGPQPAAVQPGLAKDDKALARPLRALLNRCLRKAQLQIAQSNLAAWHHEHKQHPPQCGPHGAQHRQRQTGQHAHEPHTQPTHHDEASTAGASARGCL